MTGWEIMLAVYCFFFELSNVILVSYEKKQPENQKSIFRLPIFLYLHQNLIKPKMMRPLAQQQQQGAKGQRFKQRYEVKFGAITSCHRKGVFQIGFADNRAIVLHSVRQAVQRFCTQHAHGVDFAQPICQRIKRVFNGLNGVFPSSFTGRIGVQQLLDLRQR